MRFPVFRPESEWDLITLNALNFGVSVNENEAIAHSSGNRVLCCKTPF